MRFTTLPDPIDPLTCSIATNPCLVRIGVDSNFSGNFWYCVIAVLACLSDPRGEVPWGICFLELTCNWLSPFLASTSRLHAIWEALRLSTTWLNYLSFSTEASFSYHSEIVLGVLGPTAKSASEATSWIMPIYRLFMLWLAAICLVTLAGVRTLLPFLEAPTVLFVNDAIICKFLFVFICLVVLWTPDLRRFLSFIPDCLCFLEVLDEALSSPFYSL